MISAAVGRGGETMISAQTTEAFWNAVQHVKPLSVGLNCSLGPDLMYPVPERAFGESERGDLLLSECRFAESAFGNRIRSGAGGHGSLSGRLCARRPDQHCRRLLRQHARAHRGDRQSARRQASARTEARGDIGDRSSVSVSEAPYAPETKPLRLSGSQPFTQQPGVYIMIGERTNVAGSPKFAKLIKAGQVRRSGKHRPAAGRERRQRPRHLHGRGHDRRRRGDDALPAVAGERA